MVVAEPPRESCSWQSTSIIAHFQTDAGPSDDAEVLIPGSDPAKARVARDTETAEQPGAAGPASARYICLVCWIAICRYAPAIKAAHAL